MVLFFAFFALVLSSEASEGSQYIAINREYFSLS